MWCSGLGVNWCRQVSIHVVPLLGMQPGRDGLQGTDCRGGEQQLTRKRETSCHLGELAVYQTHALFYGFLPPTICLQTA